MTQQTGNGPPGEPDPPAGGRSAEAAGGPPTELDPARAAGNLRAHRTHEWAGRVLAAEEPVLAWCLADYNGTLPPDHARLDAAIAEVAPEGHALRAVPPPEALVAFPTASRLALVLTPRRFLVFGVGLRGTPKKLLGAVPLPAVQELRAHAGQYGDQLSVVMCSGAVVDLERRDGDPPSLFVGRLAELRSPPG